MTNPISSPICNNDANDFKIALMTTCKPYETNEIKLQTSASIKII